MAMSSTAPGQRKDSGLPDDIFDYNHDQFYNIIKYSYGNDIAELLSFQSIRNGLHLVNTSCDDILLVLQEDSKEISQLKKLCCFQTANHTCQIKLGVKLALRSLIESMKMKQEERKNKKKKRSAIHRLSYGSGGLSSIAQTQFQNATTMSSAAPLISPTSPDAPLTQSESISMNNQWNDIEHLANIQERINKWWCSITHDDTSFLKQGSDYYLEINKSLNNTYTCVLTCQCRKRFKLPFMKSGLFKLSSFYRHIKEKNCPKISEVQVLHGIENNSISDEHISVDLSNVRSRSSSPLNIKSNNDKSLTQKFFKRFRSPSRQEFSSSSNSISKKNRTLSDGENTTEN